MQPFPLAQSACDDYRRFLQTAYAILDEGLHGRSDELCERNMRQSNRLQRQSWAIGLRVKDRRRLGPGSPRER